jgi:hypothetical protein
MQWRGMPALECLHLNGTRLSDRATASLAALPKLRSLDISDTAVTDGGLRELAKMRMLESLDISGTNVTATGVRESVARFPMLTTIYVDETLMKQSALGDLKQARPRLKIIKVVRRNAVYWDSKEALLSTPIKRSSDAAHTGPP